MDKTVEEKLRENEEAKYKELKNENDVEKKVRIRNKYSKRKHKIIDDQTHSEEKKEYNKDYYQTKLEEKKKRYRSEETKEYHESKECLPDNESYYSSNELLAIYNKIDLNTIPEEFQNEKIKAFKKEMKSLSESMICLICDEIVQAKNINLYKIKDLPMDQMKKHLTVPLFIPTTLAEHYHLKVLGNIFVSKKGYHNTNDYGECTNTECKTYLNHMDGETFSICTKCYRTICNNKLPKIAIANGFYIGELPTQLQDLTQQEILLCSPVILTNSVIVHVKKDANLKTKHNMYFNNSPIRIVNSFPRLVQDIQENVHVIFTNNHTPIEKLMCLKQHQCRISKIQELMKFLLENNSRMKKQGAMENKGHYDHLSEALKEDSDVKYIPGTVEEIIVNKDEEAKADMHGKQPFEDDTNMNTTTLDSLEHSVIFSQNIKSLPETILKNIFEKISNTFVYHSGTPIVHQKQRNLIALAFIDQFPYGYGAPCTVRKIQISEEAMYRHYLKLSSQSLAKHPTLTLTLFDILSTTKGFFNPCCIGENNSMMEEFCKIEENDLNAAMKFKLNSISNARRGLQIRQSRPNTSAMKMIDKAYSSLGYMFNTAEEKLNRRHNCFALWHMFGNPGNFLTTNMYEQTSLDLRFRLADNSIRFNDKRMFIHHERRKLFQKYPSLATIWFHDVCYTLLKIGLGIDPKTGCTFKDGGLIGTVYAYTGTIEEQERLALHFHLLLWITQIPHNILEMQKMKQTESWEVKVESYLNSIINCSYELPDKNILCTACEEPISDCKDLSETDECRAFTHTTKETIKNLECMHCNTKLNSDEVLMSNIATIIGKNEYNIIMESKDSQENFRSKFFNLHPNTLTEKAHYSLFQYLCLSHDSHHRWTCFKKKNKIGCRFHFPASSVPSTSVSFDSKTGLPDNIQLQRSAVSGWLPTHLRPLTLMLACNNDSKPTGPFGPSFQTTLYITNYATKNEPNDMVTASLVLAGFRKRKKYEKSEENQNKTAAQLGRSRLLSTIMNMSGTIQTGSFLASHYILYGGPSSMESHQFTSLNISNIIAFVNDDKEYGKLYHIERSEMNKNLKQDMEEEDQEHREHEMKEENEFGDFVNVPYRAHYQYRPVELREFSYFAFESLFTITKRPIHSRFTTGKSHTLHERYKYDFLGWLIVTLLFGNDAKEKSFDSKFRFCKSHPLFYSHEVHFRPKAKVVTLTGKCIPSVTHSNSMDETLIRYNQLAVSLFHPWDNLESLIETIESKKKELEISLSQMQTDDSSEENPFDSKIVNLYQWENNQLGRHVLQNIHEIHLCKEIGHEHAKKEEMDQAKLKKHLKKSKEMECEETTSEVNEFQLLDMDMIEDSNNMNENDDIHTVTNVRIEEALDVDILANIDSVIQYNQMVDHKKLKCVDPFLSSKLKDWKNSFLGNVTEDESVKLLKERLATVSTFREAIMKIKELKLQNNTDIHDIFNDSIPSNIDPYVMAARRTLDPDQLSFFLFFAYILLVDTMKLRERLYAPESEHKKLTDEINQEFPIESRPKLCIMIAEAGSGKSHVLDTLKDFVMSWNMPLILALTATLGIAALNFGGMTYQKFLRYSMFKKKKKQNLSDEVNLEFSWLLMFVIDECSLLSCEGFYKAVERMKELRNNKDGLGDVIWLLVGDWRQNKPIQETSLINSIEMKSGCNKNAMIGASYFQKTLTHVFQLKVQHRQMEESRLLSIFRNMRINNVTENDCEIMNERCLISEGRQCPNPLIKPYIPFIVRTHHARFKIQQLVLQKVQMKNIPLICLKATVQNKRCPLTNEEISTIYRLHEDITQFVPTRLIVFYNMPVMIVDNTIQIENEHKVIQRIHGNKYGIANGTRCIIKKLHYSEDVTYTKENICIYGSYFDVLVPSIEPEAIELEVLDANQKKLLKKLKLDHLEEGRFVIQRQNKTIYKKFSNGQTFSFTMKQFPLLPAIAITGHKIEGMNAKDGLVILEKGSNEWMYTTYTRVHNEENLFICYEWDDDLKNKLNRVNKRSDDSNTFLEEKASSTRETLNELFQQH